MKSTATDGIMDLWYAYQNATTATARLDARNAVLTALQPRMQLYIKLCRVPDGFNAAALMSEANNRLMETLDRYDPSRGKITTFATRQTKYAIRDVRRRLQRQPIPANESDCVFGLDRSERRHGIQDAYASPVPSPAQSAAISQLWDIIRQKLTPSEYKVIEAKYRQGRWFPDIAHEMQVDRSTVMYHHRNAIAKLRKRHRGKPKDQMIRTLLEAARW